MTELDTPQAGDDRAEDNDVVALLMRQHGDIRNLFDEVEAGSGEERRDAFRRLVRLLAVHETAEEEVVHPFAQRSRLLDALQPVTPEDGKGEAARPRFTNDELGLAPVSRDQQKIDLPVPRDAIEIGADCGIVTEIRIHPVELAAEAQELLDEGAPDASAVGIVEVQDGTALEAEPVANPLRQGGAVTVYDLSGLAFRGVGAVRAIDHSHHRRPADAGRTPAPRRRRLSAALEDRPKASEFSRERSDYESRVDAR